MATATSTKAVSKLEAPKDAPAKAAKKPVASVSPAAADKAAADTPKDKAAAKVSKKDDSKDAKAAGPAKVAGGAARGAAAPAGKVADAKDKAPAKGAAADGKDKAPAKEKAKDKDGKEVEEEAPAGEEVESNWDQGMPRAHAVGEAGWREQVHSLPSLLLVLLLSPLAMRIGLLPLGTSCGTFLLASYSSHRPLPPYIIGPSLALPNSAPFFACECCAVRCGECVGIDQLSLRSMT
jgi:hypothetical protein